MPLFEHTATYNAPVEALWSWYDSPGAFRRIMPEWEGIQPIQAGALIDGATTRFRVKLGTLRPMWIARHYGVESGSGVQRRDGKRSAGAWDYEHRFIGVNASSSQIKDTVTWRLPFHLTFWYCTVHGQRSHEPNVCLPNYTGPK